MIDLQKNSDWFIIRETPEAGELGGECGSVRGGPVSQLPNVISSKSMEGSVRFQKIATIFERLRRPNLGRGSSLRGGPVPQLLGIPSKSMERSIRFQSESTSHNLRLRSQNLGGGWFCPWWYGPQLSVLFNPKVWRDPSVFRIREW